MAKYSIKFNDEDFNNYLEHHGIKGQKWGVRRSLEELGYKVNQRRKRRRHDRILKDPRLLAKHINEFSQEEIDKRVKELKNAELVRKSANLPVKLKGKKARWAKDPNKLEKHRNDLTDEEFEEAMKRLNDDQKIHEAKMKQMSRLNDYVAKGADFIKSISGIATNTENIRSKIEKWQNLDKEKAEAELDRQLKVEKARLQNELLVKNKEEKEIANRNAKIKGYAEYLDTKKKTEIAEKSYKADTKRKNAESKANIAEVKARTEKIKRGTRKYKARPASNKSDSANIVSSKSYSNRTLKQLLKGPVSTEHVKNYLDDIYEESQWSGTRIEDLMKVRHSDLFSEDILGMQIDDNFLQHHGIQKDDELMHYGVLGMRWGVRKDKQYRDLIIGYNDSKKYNKLKQDYKNNKIEKWKYKLELQKLDEKLKRDIKKSEEQMKNTREKLKKMIKDNKKVSWKTLYEKNRKKAHDLFGIDMTEDKWYKRSLIDQYMNMLNDSNRKNIRKIDAYENDKIKQQLKKELNKEQRKRLNSQMNSQLQQQMQQQMQLQMQQQMHQQMHDQMMQLHQMNMHTMHMM